MTSSSDYEAVPRGDTAIDAHNTNSPERWGSASSKSSSSSYSSVNLDESIDAFMRRFSDLPGNAPAIDDESSNDDDGGSRRNSRQEDQDDEELQASFVFSTLTNNYDEAATGIHPRSFLAKTHSDSGRNADDVASRPHPKPNRFHRLSLSRSWIPSAPLPSQPGSRPDRISRKPSMTAGIGRRMFQGKQASGPRLSEGAESALGDGAEGNGSSRSRQENGAAADPVDFERAYAGDSEVERIVHRLESRNANRVPVPAEVKTQFLKLCDEACKRRVAEYASAAGDAKHSVDSSTRRCQSGGYSFPSVNSIGTDDVFAENIIEEEEEPVRSTLFSSCILREDIIEIRNTIRLQLERRTKSSRIADTLKQYLGLKCHASLLLKVLNRAVDSIDRSDHAQARFRRKLSELNHSAAGDTMENGESHRKVYRGDRPKRRSSSFERQRQEDEWFYYKDFVFYNLKIESKYPWMRNAGVFSILVTFAYYLFTPILWCSILRDEAICPGNDDGDSPNSVHGWLTSLYFASTTSSTVGYGDVSIFGDGDELTEPEDWRIFIAILFMIMSLIVSIVGFQAGLDSNFELFRRKLDLFANRVVEILKDGGVIKEKSRGDDVFSKIWYAKIMLLSEIIIIFTILNLLGVFSLQFSIWLSEEDIQISWMKSLYWAVQTTTTIGYGDVSPPEGFRWFLLFYLAISTYAVGSAFGKLRDFSAKLESMRLLYAWQQQEASHAMLADFSGKPDGGDGDESKEIDQFEFTIASLVLMGKVSSKDILPIMEKFKRLTQHKPNKITPADVSGPIKRRKKRKDILKTQQKATREPRQYRRGSMAVGRKIVEAFREEVLSSNATTKVSKREKQNSSVDEKMSINHSQFSVPKNTYGIAIDDSKIQRKLLAKLLDCVGIPHNRCTVVGDGRDEIMGFEDYVISFIERHPQDYFFLVVDENLDVLDDSSKHETISGSMIVQNIRKRLPLDVEKRMVAIIRSANDSASDIAVYNSRAHGFIAKGPIKRDKVNETIAPIWLNRFPSAETITETGSEAGTEKGSSLSNYDVSLPYDVSREMATINNAIENNLHVTDLDRFHGQMSDLKSNLLAIKSDSSVIPIIGMINLMLQNPESDVTERWCNIRNRVDGVLSYALHKNFRVPKNTHGIALDSSRIQRKLLSNFFLRIGIPDNKSTIVGEKRDEIMGFEDFVINFSDHHKDSFLLVVVHENLDVESESSGRERLSGSLFVKNIRQRLSKEAEGRMLILIQSTNSSPSDIAVYNSCAHGYLPSIFDGVNDLLAPLWLKRFPLSLCGDFPLEKVNIPQSPQSNPPSPFHLAQLFVDIDHLVEDDIHSKQLILIKELLKDLKNSLMASDHRASMISIFGMINGILTCEGTDNISQKWSDVRLRIDETIDLNSLTLGNYEKGTMTFDTSQLRKISSLALRLKPSRKVSLARNRSRGSSIQSSLFLDGSLSSSTISSELSVSSDKSLDRHMTVDDDHDKKLESSSNPKPNSISVEFNASMIHPDPSLRKSRKERSRTDSIDSDISGKDLESRVSSQLYSTLFDYPSSSEAESETHGGDRKKRRDRSESLDQLFSLLDAKASAKDNNSKQTKPVSIETIVPTKGAE